MISRRVFLLILSLGSLGLASPSADEDAREASVKRMLEAIDRYQKWVAKRDYDQVQRAWREVTRVWGTLDTIEQGIVEKRRPGTRRWMESGSDYDGDLSEPP